MFVLYSMSAEKKSIFLLFLAGYSSHRTQEREYAASCLHVRGIFPFLSASGTLTGLLFTLQPVIAQNRKECYDNQQNKRQELKFYG